ncbi:MT-A70-domain-containing protein [Polychytrium aggregatum]|uniref:MT-A70-domain-containing protein n=1 Tax=Polychytrium aggregatum TaxID=110093 RepID=UPI0022FDC94D|nr:MT-A70-domain-containing protein [Polychytrium aggregatum]KAI9208124.1 MT-A70-domain-containing protein [Polychytrium aggregatum]
MKGSECSVSDMATIFDRMVVNDSPAVKKLLLDGHVFIVPPHSRFLMSDISNTSPLVSDQYDIVMMDPPWLNKSVKRSQRYQGMDHYDLFQLPVKRIANPGALIAVWVTNRPKLIRFVQEKLLPDWGATPVACWYWVKVTNSCECVVSMESLHRKPYERLIIGRVRGSDAAIDYPALPPTRVICSVPGQYHSKKPLMNDLFHQFLPESPRCLELFARNLYPGWTSWGNQVLHFNHESFFLDKDLV